MFFAEHFPTYDEHILRTTKVESHTNIIDKQIQHLVVNLLPEHPYQYPFHQYIKESLTAENIDSIKEIFQIRDITFIANRKMKYFYAHIIKDLKCKVLYRRPEYPSFFNTNNKFTGEQTQILNWFDFIVISLDINGKRVKDVPVMVTTFNLLKKDNDIRLYNVKSGLKVSEMIKLFNIPDNNTVLLGHPFRDEIILPDNQISGIQPTTILVYPIGLKNKPSINNNLPFMFRNRVNKYKEYNIVSNTYRDKPCQKCLRCSSICPVDLYPFMLSAIAAEGSMKDAVNLNLESCIECGLCSYACPSDIPLMHNIIKLKKDL